MRLPEHLRALYTQPFKYDGYAYIQDANHHTVADFGNPNDTLRPRGWGRLQQMKDGMMLHDQMEAFLLFLCADCLGNAEQCVERLNAAWDTEPSEALDLLEKVLSLMEDVEGLPSHKQKSLAEIKAKAADLRLGNDNV